MNTEQAQETISFNELKELRIISNTDGRPRPTLNNEIWQKEFNIRRKLTVPYPKEVKQMVGEYNITPGLWNTETSGAYYSEDTWKEYCKFINSVIDNLKRNQVDYCYFTYQINDLLKFYPNSLQSEYCDGYWKVWLDEN